MFNGKPAPLPVLTWHDVHRFNRHIDYSGECWIWTGCTRIRYGVITIDGKTYGAHRIAYLIATGHDPGGLYVCHHCDNPPCVRPEHLFLSSPSGNIKDSIDKGRRHGTNDVFSFWMG